MKISIITICFNSENVIRRTIESVLHQDYSGNVEYLIIDGASKDKTVGIAEEYKEQFKEKGYTYIINSEPDKGIYDAMNKGIMKSTGDIIGIINSGDWFEPNALETVATEYRNEHFDYFFADISIIRTNGAKMIKKSRIDKYPTSRHWNHPTCFVTSKTYNELGCFLCTGIHDDFEFYLRVKNANRKIVVKNVLLANYTMGGASNIKSFKKCIGRIKDRYNAYRANGYSMIYIVECVGIEVAKLLLG